MYVAAAKRRFGADVAPRLRGTIQADVLKEVQAQNEMIFPVEASLRFLTDMVEYTTKHMPKWYPISISGYHIAEGRRDARCNRPRTRFPTGSPTSSCSRNAAWT